MSRFKKLVREIHRRSLWQALAVYIGASFAILEAVDLLIERIGLPELFFPVALGLLVIGLPIILVTASIHSTRPAQDSPGEAGVPAAMAESGADLDRLLTWRNALGGGMAAFALWGLVAAIWLLLFGGPTSVTEVAADPQPQLTPTSVAVLYFEDFSESQDLGHLADGLTEALIHELAQVNALRVISRNGVKRYRDPDVPIDSIARALNAGSIVEGSVEQLGDQLRVTVQLIDGNDGAHLLSRRVERSGGNLLLLRDDVVEEAARLLRQRLGEEVQLRERRAGTTSDEAWELLQRAEVLRKDADDLWSAGDSARSTRLLLDADSLLERAEQLDPVWVEPIILRGRMSIELAVHRGPEYGVYDRASADAALAHAERALERWPDNAQALALRGRVRARLWEQAGDSLVADTLRTAAERDLRRAVEADPQHAVAWATLARVLRKGGQFAAARLAAEKAYAADAYLAEASYVLFNLCHISIELKQFEDAARWCEEGRRRFPEHGFFIEPQLLLLASAIGPAPDVDQAWELYERMLETYAPQRREGLRPTYMMYVAAVLARAGLADSARAMIERAHAATDTSADPIIRYYEANVRLRLAEPAEAVRLLAAYLESNPNQRPYLAADWWWDELRDDPRFQELIGTG